MKHYFNTIKIHGHELKAATRQAIKQDFVILAAFQKRGLDFDANCWEVFNFREVTKAKIIEKCVRRSCTTLKKFGYLKFVNVKRKGQYHVMNNCFSVTSKGLNKKL